ncbi:MAG: type I-E CRISPR-associated endoribonuclease Cas2 [Phycisphaeraceae bacterium]|nr:type I-E CRISPR-associated endoribonuclease Cas2 [Phycisphaeraceae bacterium]
MMILILSKVRPGLRGRLTRWLVQPQSGVYLGHPSARIRERLWALVCEEIDTRGGSAILIAPTPTEQGYSVETRGQTPKDFVDFDGLTLPKTRKKAS